MFNYREFLIKSNIAQRYILKVLFSNELLLIPWHYIDAEVEKDYQRVFLKEVSIKPLSFHDIKQHQKMLCIIRSRSSVGSGCVLSDFGESSLDDTASDRDTVSDCSVRYFCESALSDYPAKESHPTSSISEATNMAERNEVYSQEEIDPYEDAKTTDFPPSIENSIFGASESHQDSIIVDSLSSGE